jgi:hypothetical protein
LFDFWFLFYGFWGFGAVVAAGDLVGLGGFLDWRFLVVLTRYFQPLFDEFGGQQADVCFEEKLKKNRSELVTK